MFFKDKKEDKLAENKQPNTSQNSQYISSQECEERIKRKEQELLASFKGQRNKYEVDSDMHLDDITGIGHQGQGLGNPQKSDIKDKRSNSDGSKRSNQGQHPDSSNIEFPSREQEFPRKRKEGGQEEEEHEDMNARKRK